MGTLEPALRTGSVPSEELLAEVVRRIVAAIRPLRIVLFGSAARGDMGPNSDLDLLIVKDGVERRAVERAVRRALIGLGVAKDVVVATPSEIEQHGSNRGLVLYSALREGRVLYAA